MPSIFLPLHILRGTDLQSERSLSPKELVVMSYVPPGVAGYTVHLIVMHIWQVSVVLIPDIVMSYPCPSIEVSKCDNVYILS